MEYQGKKNIRPGFSMLNKTYYDVVLFSPPSRMVNHYRPPLGLLYLGGYLKHRGKSVKIIDVPIKEQVRNAAFFKNISPILEEIHKKMISGFNELKTRIVGISCYTPEFYETLLLAKTVKKIDPSVIVVVGGVHPTLYPQDFFNEDTGVDVCVLGEGEEALADICDSLISRKDGNLKDIAGIVFKDKTTGQVVFTAPRPLVRDLDTISHPDYSLIDMDYYTTANPYAIRGCFLRSMYLLSTRGCPSQCTFCVAKKLRPFNGTGRSRSAESLISELKVLKKEHGIDAFYFIDDLFTINKENVKRFCSLMKKEKLGLLWGCSSKVSTLNEDLIAEMSRSGCVQIDFGVECGSDEALTRIKKGINVAMIKKTFSLCNKYGVRTFANILVNLPGETEKDLEDILRLLDDIKPEIVSFNIFTPYPGTEIYDNCGFVFKKEDYAALSKPTVELLEGDPARFRFCCHEVDLQAWVRRQWKLYNKTWANIKFYLDLRYLILIMRSKNKKNYLVQLSLLLREFINQKYSN